MGTISQSDTNINSDGKLYQKSFSASRVEYEHPSLEYIGTGEGNQAHGWGLYYALKREIAESYREEFTKDAVKVLIGETSIEDLVNSYEWHNDDFYVARNIIEDIKWHLGKIKHFETEGIENSEAGQLILLTIDSY